LDWDGHSKISLNTRLKSNRFILNHKLSEHHSFIKCVILDKRAALRKLVIQNKPVGL